MHYRFPLSLRMVEERLAARGIKLTYETVWRWSVTPAALQHVGVNQLGSFRGPE